MTACHLFAYRLSFSGFAVHRVYASSAQEALLEGHVAAFAVTCGVPCLGYHPHRRQAVGETAGVALPPAYVIDS